MVQTGDPGLSRVFSLHVCMFLESFTTKRVHLISYSIKEQKIIGHKIQNNDVVISKGRTATRVQKAETGPEPGTAGQRIRCQLTDTFLRGRQGRPAVHA